MATAATKTTKQKAIPKPKTSNGKLELKNGRDPKTKAGWDPQHWSACNELQQSLAAIGVAIPLNDIGEWKDSEREEVADWITIINRPGHNARLPAVLQGKLPPGWRRAREEKTKVLGDPSAWVDALKPGEVGDRRELPIGSLVPSPTNPRKAFSQEAIDSLAQSFKNVGILQSLLVRPHAEQDGKYEIVAGERRWRAAKQAGLKMVPVEIRDLLDEEVLEAQLIENLEREQLNPIEEAIAFQQLVETSIYSERTLASRLKLSQGHISNRIRLLKLPEAWQQRVISREITTTDARDLATWAHRPEVLDLVAKDMGKRHYRQWYLRQAIEACSRPLGADYHDRKTHRFLPVTLTKKEKEREDLDVEEVKCLGCKRAFNVRLWDDLQSAGLKRREERSQSNGKAGAKLSPAEAKRKAEQKAEQWKKRLYRYKIHWLQMQIGEALRDLDYADAKNEAILWRAAIVLMASSCTNRMIVSDEINRSRGRAEGSVRWKEAASLADGAVLDVVHGTFWRTVLEEDVESYRSPLRAEDIEGIAADLGIDIKRDWRQDEEFLKLHTKDQLLDLAEEWKVPLPGLLDGKRGEIIKNLWHAAREAKCPKELAAAKARLL